ncbi:uncharacterized protein LOC141850286 [Brevipalpus obovatus]|uniref:uncharacterized protein LOC141850286 n=1 Tax=Brevipalpus obovatus TaxID=246614 RepID=UPI003D9F85C8
MYWNKLCFYALMCFTTRHPEIEKELPSCEIYQSEDVNRMSLVIDVKNLTNILEGIDGCFAIQRTHTLLLHQSGFKGKYTVFPRVQWRFIDMEHLILVKVPFPFEIFDAYERHYCESLTAIENDHIPGSVGLQSYMFKHIHLDKCRLSDHRQGEIDQILFTSHVQTIYIVGSSGFNPTHLKYYLAPNLKRLSIINCWTHSTLEFIKKINSFPSLESLDLRGNLIQSVTRETFSPMPRLKEIDLSYNHLMTIEGISWPAKLQKLQLHGNPLRPSETLCEFLRTSPYAFFAQKAMICPAINNSPNK